nr:MAG TPA: hypothetical protein [Caudoviricetes sp.]
MRNTKLNAYLVIKTTVLTLHELSMYNYSNSKIN